MAVVLRFPSECPPASSHGHAPTDGRHSISLLPSRFLCISFTIPTLPPLIKPRAMVIGSGPNGLSAPFYWRGPGTGHGHEPRPNWRRARSPLSRSPASPTISFRGPAHGCLFPCFEQFPLAAHGLEWVTRSPVGPPAGRWHRRPAGTLHRLAAAGLGPMGKAWRRLVEPAVDAGRACVTTCWRRRTCRATPSKWAKFGFHAFVRARLAESSFPRPARPRLFAAWPPTSALPLEARPAPPSACPRHRRARRWLAIPSRERSASPTPWPAT